MRIARDAIDGLPEGIHDPCDLGPMFEESTAHGGLVLSKRWQIRSLDAEFLQTIFPWATDADQKIFFLGWEMGEAFSYGSDDKTKTAVATCDDELSVVSAKS